MFEFLKIIISILICIVTFATSATAAEGPFSWPIACVPGIDCTGKHFRIGYPDVNGTGLSFACSKPGYLGHQGTDIVVSSIEQGVHVLAASDGVVKWTENNKFDHCPNIMELQCNEEEKSTLSAGNQKGATLGFNAGNFVVIEHTIDNIRYLTLYAHLRKGSVTVSTGHKITTGQYIGDVASSGNSQIPHLHFGVYKAEGTMYRPVDPWKGACNTSSDGLWMAAIPYRSDDLLLAHPSQNLINDSEIYLQTIQRSLPKKLFY